MSNEKSFPKGIRFYDPKENAPDFIKGNIQINVDEFIEYLQDFKKLGKLHLQVLKSKKTGASYIDLDKYKMDKLKDSDPSEVFGSKKTENQIGDSKKENDLPF